ncbi:uncharacterized protein LOC125423140 [Ziziphus jujuba]|uniref:Uncharacterized protein LOC125423140 n=1 Tax=Ziziphus jujuba TaxID=326968 RepID=A0ABM3IPD3_ZIZJJ|nr:uncharacterized protein LOC125423140 [Ziziphus jujuba]
MEIKQVAQTLIVSHVLRFIRALSNAKSKATSHLIQLLKEKKPMQWLYITTRKNTSKIKKMINKEAKIFFDSFRLHYDWCSSTHVLPVPALVEDCPESQLSGYLEWLEKNDVHDKTTSMADQSEADVDNNDIDRQADLFIARCHEKFRSEMEESYRRYQETLARSM